MGPEVKNVLCSATRIYGLSWSLWQKVPGDTQGQPLGFWSWRYRWSKANYTPTEKEILAAYEGVQAASEVIGMEAQLLLAPRLAELEWLFKAKVPYSHHATNAMWSKWIALITQHTPIGKLNRPGILEVSANCPEGENFGVRDEEEQEQVADATEGEGGSSQLAELKTVQLAVDIAEREKCPKLYLYIDSWMVANALWGWLERWKEANWQRRGKPIWAAEEWKDIATRVIHDCDMCAAIKQAKRVKPLRHEQEKEEQEQEEQEVKNKKNKKKKKEQQEEKVEEEQEVKE
ncbi:hypothetical protein TURU_093538 [Turdus rufiventris]|nr:hypothetical protein TURU_093538 [Turdus rufiventris]